MTRFLNGETIDVAPVREDTIFEPVGIRTRSGFRQNGALVHRIEGK